MSQARWWEKKGSIPIAMEGDEPWLRPEWRRGLPVSEALREAIERHDQGLSAWGRLTQKMPKARAKALDRIASQTLIEMVEEAWAWIEKAGSMKVEKLIEESLAEGFDHKMNDLMVRCWIAQARGARLDALASPEEMKLGMIPEDLSPLRLQGAIVGLGNESHALAAIDGMRKSQAERWEPGPELEFKEQSYGTHMPRVWMKALNKSLDRGEGLPLWRCWERGELERAAIAAPKSNKPSRGARL